MLFLPSAVVLSFCMKPIEPGVEPGSPVDASKDIREIQLKTERDAEKISQMARRQAGADVENAIKAIALEPGSGGGGQSPDAGAPLRLSAGIGEVAGKLERATPNFVIIRDSAGFAYWLRTSGTMQVTLDGQPARLTDFAQGADVRAVFAWQGKERVATEVEVLSAGQLVDGGQAADGGS